MILNAFYMKNLREKRLDTSRGLKPTSKSQTKYKKQNKCTQNGIPRILARPPVRGVWGAAALRKIVRSHFWRLCACPTLAGVALGYCPTVLSPHHRWEQNRVI